MQVGVIAACRVELCGALAHTPPHRPHALLASAPRSNSSTEGSIDKCGKVRGVEMRRAVACAGRQRTCFAKLPGGSWVVDKLCNATESNIAPQTSEKCQREWAAAAQLAARVQVGGHLQVAAGLAACGLSHPPTALLPLARSPVLGAALKPLL